MAQNKPANEALTTSAAPHGDTAFPVALSREGWPIGPTTVLYRKPHKPGEPFAEDSIFSVPPSLHESVKIMTVQEQLEELYEKGYRGQAIFDFQGPHPLVKDRRESVSRSHKYPPTECKICTALVSGVEKMEGYTMLELRHARLFGCTTCSTLYRAIRHFAAILTIEYEDWESKSRARDH
jgi:hypothetical protein